MLYEKKNCEQTPCSMSRRHQGECTVQPPSESRNVKESLDLISAVNVKGNIPRISSYTWLFAKNTG